MTDGILRHRTRVLAAALILVPILALLGGRVEEHLSAGGFIVEDSESARAEQLLEEEFESGPSDWGLVISLKEGVDLDDEETEAAGLALTAAIGADPGVVEVVSFWTLGEFTGSQLSPLQSPFGRHAVAAAVLSGSEDEQRETAIRLEGFSEETELWTAHATGSTEVSRQAREQAEKDLVRSELLAAPLTLIALLVVFKGFRPALLPLIVAVFSILATYTVLRLLAGVTSISVFALNLTTGLGLGLAIDYSLLIVARFREELGEGHAAELALTRTMQTAGKTVIFSAATVAASLTALLVFPATYLRSFAFAGVTVVAASCLASVVVLPALLIRMADRIGAQEKAGREGFWKTQTERVIRHPLRWATAVTVLLVIVGLPFLSFNATRIDDRVLPESNSARQGADILRTEFAFRNFNGIGLVAPGVFPSDEEIRAFQSELLALPHIYRVDSPLGFFGVFGGRGPLDFSARYQSEAGIWFRVISLGEPDDERSAELLESLRTLETDFADEFLLTGVTASVDDTVDAVVGRLPLALGIIAAITLVVLFMMTGSVVIPLKAVVLNLLSLTATFGALVWIFQDGNLTDWLGVTATGSVDVYTPVLMFCIAFGLSMDYEVFLISRIKEEYDLTGDNDVAVVNGIASTGHIVTAAAVLLTIVFVAIATSGVAIVKMFGIGLAIAVLVDAFLVRATLTPALMKAAGRLNWWAPASLRRFHLRWGIWENEPITLPSDTAATDRTTED